MTTLFGNTAVMAIAAPKSLKKKHSLLPVLTVLFMVSYGLMTMLIVEQGSVIQSQSNLIKILLPESTELWGLKGKALTEKLAANARAKNSVQALPAQGPSTQNPSKQMPSTQMPSTQAQSTQTPSTQERTQQHSSSRAGKLAKPGFEAPPVPAADLADHRRALVTI